MARMVDIFFGRTRHIVVPKKMPQQKNLKSQRFQGFLSPIFQVKIKRCHRRFSTGERDLNYLRSV